MRAYFATIAVTGLLFGSAMAANNARPAQSGPNNPAVNTTGQNNSSAPVAGANSFTQSEAQSRIEAHGYTHVSGLMKDSKGVWRGHARKDGHRVHVSVDFEGNVN